MDFRLNIIDWYKKNKRDLPWRNTNDAYKIWLSEIILQQTRVNQGLAYYLKFVARFPDVFSLAQAKEDEVLNLWQGLGYYSRARNMHAAAKMIVKEYKGVFPDDYKIVLSLKGVGEYTAAAIMSLAYKKPYPVVDGNVFRLLSRFFGDKKPIDSSGAKKYFAAIANKLIDKKQPDIFNQAMMELGALVCLPKNPNCQNCRINAGCYAFQHNAQINFPVKNKKQKVRERYFYYFYIEDDNEIVIRKRIGKDIWQHLFDFPLFEGEKPLEIENIFRQKPFQSILNKQDFTIKDISEPIKHILTHQKIMATFIHIEIKNNTKGALNLTRDMQWINKNQINDFAFPRLIEKYLENVKSISYLCR